MMNNTKKKVFNWIAVLFYVVAIPGYYIIDHQMTTSRKAGRPYDCYTVKKFKTGDDFLAWDGVLQTKDGK